MGNMDMGGVTPDGNRGPEGLPPRKKAGEIDDLELRVGEVTDWHRCHTALDITNGYLQYLKGNNLIAGTPPKFGVADYVELMQGKDPFPGLCRFLKDHGVLDYDKCPDYEEPDSKDTILAVARYIPRRERSELQALRERSGIEIPEGLAFEFDMDGVILFTPHEKCWKAVFDPILRDEGQALFDAADYFKYVSGKNRYQGIRDFLVHRGIMPQASMAIKDPYRIPEEYPRVNQIAEEKNILVRGCLKNEPIVQWEPTVALMKQAYEAGIPVVVVSASKSTGLALAQSDLARFTDAAFEGRIAAIKGLPGKPDPAPFTYGAVALGARPGDCVVFEDADKGILSGKAAGAGFLIGLAESEIATQLMAAGIDLTQALKEAGADVVVSSMAEMPLEKVIDLFTRKRRCM